MGQWGLKIFQAYIIPEMLLHLPIQFLGLVLGQLQKQKLIRPLWKVSWLRYWSKYLKMHFTDCNKILTLVGAKSQLDTSGKIFSERGNKTMYL